MNAVTLKQAERNLEQLIKRVVADAEPTIIVTESGERVVLLPLDEYNSWKETQYLLSNPANSEHLRQSIRESQEGAMADLERLWRDQPGNSGGKKWRREEAYDRPVLL
jgi:antitoxin YefM